ncbi:MAG: exodeoxyribonuclease VII large subunit [Ruminococcus sp.]|jgi:exodeoxyribonuclease VII large subunit|nr:exodeoxyribonuclease VII large subunit [Ruminococcus sp.]
MTNTVLSVSQINRYISMQISDDSKLKNVLVRGEITNFVNHRQSGHYYFSLKDESCAIKAVMFKSNAMRLGFIPENGMSVILTGDIRVFERDGLYQIYTTDIVNEGAGKLFAAYNQLKEKLFAAGIFDASHKKDLPPFPETIGVVTSADGAVIQDIRNVLKRRAPYVKILLFPVKVQGIDADIDIAAGIKKADEAGVDLIICGRGGGSFEDLFAFSSEITVRAFYNAVTPIISAVGHETDNALCDLAADLRAPTPSAAAEQAVLELTQLYEMLDGYKSAALNRFNNTYKIYAENLTRKTEKLRLLSPRGRIENFSERLTQRRNGLKSVINEIFTRKENELAKLILTAENVNPLKVLSRGYTLVTKNGKTVAAVNDTQSGDRVNIRFFDGEKSAVID